MTHTHMYKLSCCHMQLKYQIVYKENWNSRLLLRELYCKISLYNYLKLQQQSTEDYNNYRTTTWYTLCEKHKNTIFLCSK